MRRAPGATSCRIPISLPSTSSCWLVKPVMLPPGLARLATNPLPTAITTLAMTIGIVFVARCAARAASAATNHNHVDFLPDQFARQGVQAVHIAIGIDESILDVLPLQPAEIMHSVLEGRAQIGTAGLRCERQPPDSSDRRGRLPTADPVRDEQADGACQQDTASRDHWITSSARSSRDCGMVRPSALAVVVLMINSKVLACPIGRSPGFAPFSMRST